MPIFSAVVSTWVGPHPRTSICVSHVNSNHVGTQNPAITSKGVVRDDARTDGSMSGDGGSRSGRSASR